MLRIRFATLAVALGAGFIGPASAQEIALGKEIYADRCAVCHGEAGAGDGPVGELFEVRPKNLTNLAAENNGAFPFSTVYQSIDGRRDITAHGNTQMPIWGEYFIADAIADPSINPKDAQMITQARILAVVYYLQTLQD